MTRYKRVAIDASKPVSTPHGIDAGDHAVLRTNSRRGQMRTSFKKLPPAETAIEACGGSHHRAREPTAPGHRARPIPPRHVKPRVKRGGNDRGGAEAVCGAAGRPGMRFVPVKTLAQQAQGMALKARGTLVHRRARLASAFRGHAAEFGAAAARGPGRISASQAAIEQEAAMPAGAKEMFALLGREGGALDGKAELAGEGPAAAHEANPAGTGLATVPGIGPVTAPTLATGIDPGALQSGRHPAAWAGLTPKERSAGGKQRMGGVSRAGSKRPRCSLVNGATAVTRSAMRPDGKQTTGWLRALPPRKPREVAALAPANKMARIARAVMTSGGACRRPGGSGVTMVPSRDAVEWKSCPRP